MRLAILSRKPSLFSTRRFVEVARHLGHQAVVLDPLQCMLGLSTDTPFIMHHGKRLAGISIVLPRIGSSITEYGLAVVRHFELCSVLSLNASLAINVSRDKWRTFQALRAENVPVPATALLRSRTDLSAAIDMLGGLPVVVKKVQGTQGIGVFLAESLNALESMLETLWGLDQNVLLQQYVSESVGRDLRALVVGDRVIGAMRRQARPGEFRANLHRGGEGESVELRPDYAEAAINAVKATGLQVGGVDMLETQNGPLVLEVNSSPGFEGLEKATGTDIAALILDHAFKLAEQVGT